MTSTSLPANCVWRWCVIISLVVCSLASRAAFGGKPTGACCVSHPLGGVNCHETTEFLCEFLLGVWQGDDSLCVETACSPPTGACCIASDPSCIVTTAAHCAMIGGVYVSNNTPCGDSGCPAPCYINLGTGNAHGLLMAECQLDDAWVLRSSPLTPVPVPARTTAMDEPTWIFAHHGVWLGESTGAMCSFGEPPGNYVYEYYFTLDFEKQRDFLLTTKMAADDIATVFLNGNTIGLVPGPDSLTTISTGVPSFFNHGVNTLSVHVNNLSFGSVGLLVQGRVRFRQMMKDLSTGVDVDGTPLSHGDVDPHWWRCSDFHESIFAVCNPDDIHEPIWCTDPADGSWVSHPAARWIEADNNAPTAFDECNTINELVGCHYWNDFVLDATTHTGFKLDLHASASTHGMFWLDHWLGPVNWTLPNSATLTHLQLSDPVYMTPGHHLVLAQAALGPASNSVGFFAVGGVFGECLLEDCNGNGHADVLDIANGYSKDCNGDGVPDECLPPPPCPADFLPPGGDCEVTIAELTAVVAAFGLPCAGCPEDIAPPGGDGVVSISDINAVMAALGPCP